MKSMSGARRGTSVTSSLIRFALGALLPGAIAFSACRKAEPEELVNARPNATGGAFGGTDGSGGEAPAPTGGRTGDGGGTNAGSGGSSEVADGSITETDGAVVEPPPPHCVVPDIPTGVPFSKAALLEQAADCAIGRYCLFSTRANSLRDAADAFAGDGSADKREALRTAWKAAMESWQEAEHFRFGPAASSTSPGGQDLRDLIYSWPATARCKIDEQTLSRFYTSANFTGSPTQSLVSGRSLAALEYLAFYERPDNGCNAFSTVNAQNGWPSLSAAEIANRRAAYARAVADDVARQAERLLAAWAASGSNFRNVWITAGSGSATYSTQQAALNALNEALFYIENDVKDLKLALPSGISPDCPSAVCPDSAEAPYAKVSTANLKRNLVGFRRLFQGCGEEFGGLGFDDWLRSAEIGRGDLADRIIAATDAVDAELARFDLSIDAAVVTDLAKVEALYAAVKAVTDPLKGELVTVLNLELPGATEGDND